LFHDNVITAAGQFVGPACVLNGHCNHWHWSGRSGFSSRCWHTGPKCISAGRVNEITNTPCTSAL